MNGHAFCAGGFCLVFSQNRLVHRTAIVLEDAGFEIRDVLLWRLRRIGESFTQEHFVRKRRIPEEGKERLIRKLDGRKTPQLKPQCEMIVFAQAPNLIRIFSAPAALVFNPFAGSGQ